jgi:putative transposase
LEGDLKMETETRANDQAPDNQTTDDDGEKQSGRPDSPQPLLPLVQAKPGETAVAGEVRTLDDRPLRNVTLRIADDHMAYTDETDLCPGSTALDRYQEWVKAGVFLKLWQVGVEQFDELKGIDWAWLSMDGAITKAPLGGQDTGPNPTDRAKSGVKRSLLTEGHGVPLGLAVEGANRHDMKLVCETIESIVVERPEPTAEQPQGMCLDKGYDYQEVRHTLPEFGFTAHIRLRGEEAKELKKEASKRARRWAAERTHSWLNRFRRILIRWEKKPENYLAFLHFACALIAFRASGLFR